MGQVICPSSAEDVSGWTPSAGTLLTALGTELPGSESAYVTSAYADSQFLVNFAGDKGASSTAVLAFRVRFNGADPTCLIRVRVLEDATDTNSVVGSTLDSPTVAFNDEWCIVYVVIPPATWSQVTLNVAGFLIEKVEYNDTTDIAWIRLLVPEALAEYPPMMLMDCRAAVTLDTTLRAQEIGAACGIGRGARFGLGSYDGSSIRRSPNDTPASAYNWSNLEDITDRLIAGTDLDGNDRPGHCLMVIGTDAPNWTTYKNAVGGTWGTEPNRPAPESWVHWAADAQAAVDHIIADYEAAGLDPTEYCLFQIANEVGIGGAGGPWKSTGPYAYDPPYSGLGEGEHDSAANISDRRNVCDQLVYLVSNVNFRGCRVLGVAHETDRDSVAFINELSALVDLAPHLPIINRPALNHYINVQNGWTLAERKRFVTTYYDSILYCKDAIAAEVENVIPGLGWDALPWALTEFGGTLTKCGMNGSAMPQFGHAKRGEFLARLAERLLQSGEFEIISFYATRERSVVTDANLFGLIKEDGTYSMAYREMARPFTTADVSSPPSGSYSTSSGETAGTG